MNTSIQAAKLKVEIFKCLFQKDKYGNLPYADETAKKTNEVFNALVHENNE